MRILHVLNELKFSGAEIMYVAAAKTFQRLGCELYVVNTSNNMGEYAPYFERAGYKVFHWPYRGLGFLQKWHYYRKVQHFVRENKIDVIHVHRSDMKFGMAFCAWACNVHSVYTFHSVFPSRWFSKPYHIWLRWASKHLFGQLHQTISDSVYEHELHYFHNKTNKIYNWYNTDKFYPAQAGEKELVRQELGIPAQVLVVISVGGCSNIKRHEDVIKAIAYLIKQDFKVLYLHLGEGSTLGEERLLARQLGIDDVVRFVGNQSDVRKYLVASDVYVMTSRFEGISITTIEAMACKIPTVLYDVPGLCDFNKGGERSLIINEVPDVLADSIKKIYSEKQYKELMMEAAYQFVTANYDMKKNATQIYELYKCAK